MTKYKDIRLEFWRDHFNRALSYADYLQAGEEKDRLKWEKAYANTELSGNQSELLGGFVRKIQVLVYTGIWCGDCVRQGPMYQKIAEGNEHIDLRFTERIDDSALADELRMNGSLKIPIVVFLSEDFFEIGRFGDRLLTIYRWMAETQLGPACDSGLVSPDPEQLQAELSEWVDIFERMHLILRLAPGLRERYGD